MPALIANPQRVVMSTPAFVFSKRGRHVLRDSTQVTAGAFDLTAAIPTEGAQEDFVGQILSNLSCDSILTEDLEDVSAAHVKPFCKLFPGHEAASFSLVTDLSGHPKPWAQHSVPIVETRGTDPVLTG